MNGKRHYEVIVIGGGTAGLSVAARLLKKDPTLDLAIIEPSLKHYYQPLWTLVGGGVFPKERSERNTADYIPKKANWVCDSVVGIDPEKNKIQTAQLGEFSYNILVLAPGLKVDWQRVVGLQEALTSTQVCSIYAYAGAEKTWRMISGFSGGRAIFTFPNTPVKCGGAPQKIMYLAEHQFRKMRIRDRANIHFYSAANSIFAVKKYADALTKVVNQRNIETHFQKNLVEVRPRSREAIFQSVVDGTTETVNYQLLHVAPPMSAPEFIKSAGLANIAGWVDVDKSTLQHIRHPNIFSLGDASSCPTSKTAAAIRKQAPVLVTNLLQFRQGSMPSEKYDGYTSCPLVTGYGKLILAEFDYDGTPRETFPWDQSKERRSMYWLKKYFLPVLYWQGMLKGRA